MPIEIASNPELKSDSAATFRARLDANDVQKNIKQRTIRGGVVTLSAQGVKFLLRLGSTAILARLLVPAEFGLIAMVSAIVGFVEMLKDAGLSAATIQRDKITHAQISTLFWINVALSLAIAGVVASIAPLVAWFYGEPKLTNITLALSFTMVFGGLAVQHQALLKREMRFGRLAAIEISAMAAGVLVAIVMARAGWGYWSLVGMTAGSAVVTAAMSIAMSGWLPGLPVRGSGVRPMLASGGNITGFSVTNYFARNFDKILIGWWWGSATLGIYTRAYSLMMMPLTQMNAPVAAVAVPALSRLVSEPERYRRAYLRILQSLAMATMPLITFLALTSEWVIRLVLGPGWGQASAIFSWLALSALVQPIANTTGWLYITQQRTREMFRWGLLGSASSLLSFAIGLPFGAVGVAASYSLAGVLIRTPLLFYYVGRRGPIKTSDFYRALRFPFLLSAIEAVVILALRNFLDAAHPLRSILISFGVSAIVLGFVSLLHPPFRSALVRFASRLGSRRPDNGKV